MRIAIAEARQDWHDYGAAIRQLIHKDYHSVIMRQILARNQAALEGANRLSKRFIDAFGAEVFDPQLTAALELAGYHRMLSQRALKETCFVLAGIGGQPMREQLAATLQEFDSVLTRLQTGDAEIAPPPNARINRNFRTANLFWKKMRATMEAILAGQTPDETTLKKMIKFNASVLKQLNQAVEGYLVGS